MILLSGKDTFVQLVFQAYNGQLCSRYLFLFWSMNMNAILQDKKATIV